MPLVYRIEVARDVRCVVAAALAEAANEGDARNTASRLAIAALGATQEGIMRRHMRLPDGFQRDSVVLLSLPRNGRWYASGWVGAFARNDPRT